MKVEELLGRYGIEVELYNIGFWDSGTHHREVLRIDKMGPSERAGLRWPDVVVADPAVGVQYILHEGVHLICATQLQDVDDVPEEDGLLQLERSLARYLNPKERRAVIDYQGITQVSLERTERMARKAGFSGTAEVGDWKRPTQTWWWREGLAKAVGAGLLTADGRPTWKRARRAGVAG